MFFEKVGDLFIGRFAELFSEHICHGFSTRKGGVSKPPYNTLNLGFNTDDQYYNVTENRKRFFKTVGISEKNVAIPEQVHGNRVRIITESGTYPESDGLITNVPDVILTIQTADCVPVFLYEPAKRVTGLVHAGWRGTYKNIIRETINTMIRNFRVKAENIHIFFGPSIGPCCYQVGDTVIHHFSLKYIHNNHLNLWLCLYDQLTEAGCLAENIYMSRLCTVCYPEWFFSHRRNNGKTGRMLAFIKIKKNT